MDEKKYVIGMDCGGTKTVALLADETGEVLGRGDSGTANMNIVGRERTVEVIREAAVAAFGSAGLPVVTLDALCIGLAGVDRPEEKEWFTRQFQDLGVARKISISNDAILLLEAGTPEGWGIGVISGTGSIVFGRSRTGEMYRAGGWGYILGDEGSGYEMGRKALIAVARAHDGRGPKTLLTEKVLAAGGLEKVTELIPFVYKEFAPGKVAPFARLVSEAAEEGDVVSQEILNSGAEELGLAIMAVLDQMGVGKPVPCALGGGILANTDGYREQVLAYLKEKAANVGPVEIVTEPVYGALRIAQGMVA